MSETLFALLLAAALLQTLRTLEVPTVRRGAVVGLLLGLAILTRAEAVLLLLLLTALVLARAPARRGVVAGSTIVVSLLIAAPWVARNWDLFGQPVLANDDGTTVAASNCRATYYGRDVGGAAFSCLVRAAGLTGPTTNEAVRAARLRRVGWRYARRHAGRAIVVAAVRVARVWGVWRPSTQFRLTGRRPGVQKLGVGMFYLLIPLAFLGGWVLRDRRSALAVLLAPMLSLTVAAAVTTANVRLRTGGELSLLVLAGVGLSSHRLLRPRSARGYTQVC